MGRKVQPRHLTEGSCEQYSEGQSRLWWAACWSVVRQAALRCSLVFQGALSEL